ncbi:hypothetical protein BDR26DRAFT_893011 [Obelidium mucronatum]|nr:hypothetical protein BDR26DRAFT_893011 [Obelidium mucronatum]
MRCTFGCRKQFKNTADLARHIQVLNPDAARKTMRSTTVGLGSLSQIVASANGDDSLGGSRGSSSTDDLEMNASDNGGDIPSDSQSEFPDELPELQSHYGLFFIFSTASMWPGITHDNLH